MGTKEVCTKCSLSITKKQSSILCFQCNNTFHSKCVKLEQADITLLQKNPNLFWKCLKCSTTNVTKSTENIHPMTPVHSSTQVDKKIQEMSHDISVLKMEMLKINDLRKENSDLKISYNFMSSKFDDFIKKIESLEKTNEIILQDNKLLKLNLSKNESCLNLIEQNLLNNNFEIHGIPEKKDEVLTNIIQKTKESLKIKCDVHIENVYRSGIKKDGKTRPIIVKARDPELKYKLLQAIKLAKGLSLSKLNFSEPGPIFINDHLTESNKKLLAQARQLRKEKTVKYVWTKDCKIFIRKTDNSKVINIKSNSDFNFLVETPNGKSIN